jgi:hypothetical protein
MANKFYLVLITILVSACSIGERNHASARNLVGVWKNKKFDNSYVIIRYGNGFYSKKSLEKYDTRKSEIEIYDKGKWSINNKKYILKSDYISSDLFKSSIGISRVQRIIRINKDSFDYISNDGVDIHELKVCRSPSPEIFKRTSIMK